jgi:transcriptional regulator with XRE-family HTH domain
VAIDRPEIIGARLKALRLALDYRQAKAFCEAIGVADTAWNNWEHGRRIVPIDVAVRIPAKTGASLDWIHRRADLESMLPAHLAERLRQVDA